MSKVKSIEHKCSVCGKHNDIVEWESLNAQLDPEEKEMLLQGNLFEYTCENCNSINKLNYPFIYHDMKRKIMIYYITSDQDRLRVEEFIKVFKTSDQYLSKNYKYRIVTSHEQLLEKIQVFDQNLDDRVIDLMKVYYLGKTEEMFPSINIRNIYYSNINLAHTYFIVESDIEYSINFDYKVYDEFSKNPEVIKRLEQETSYDINFDWAKKNYINVYKGAVN